MGRYSKSKNLFIEADMQQQIFRLSSPVFEGVSIWPRTIVDCFSSILGPKIKLDMNLEGNVILIQEIPFSWGFQPTFRHQFYSFIERAQQCRRLLNQMAVLEHRRNVDEII